MIVGYAIGGLLAQGIYHYTHKHYIEQLALEAPETLLPPVRGEFQSEAQYRIALVKYSIRGNWATEN